MEIVNYKRRILDVMESNAKGKDDFATTVISTKTVEKNIDKVRRKNQTYSFSSY